MSPANSAGDQSGVVTWQAFFQQALSALKVTASQTNSSSQQVTGSIKSSAEASISSVLQGRVNLKMAEAKARYSYETGQGYNACMISVGLSDITKATFDRDSYARKLGGRDSAWLADGGGRAEDTVSSMLSLRSEVYCSDQEQDNLAGFCQPKANGYDAGNTDASVWLSNRGYGAEEAMTGMDFIDTVAPLPTVPERSNNDAMSASQRAEAISSGVLRNAARTTLQNVILDGMTGASATE